jgi:N-acetylated-alpha-linked acidic dipeptidase
MLEKFFREVIRDIEDPAKGKSLLALAEAPGEDGAVPKPFALGPARRRVRLCGVRTPRGIPSLNLSFGGAGASGTYHSIYDSYAWFSTQMDKDFQYSRLLAQVMGTSMLRMSEAPLVPHDFQAVARVVRQWAGEIKTQYSKLDLSEVNKSNRRTRHSRQAVSGCVWFDSGCG